jgi:hypothetical protein
MFIAHTLNVLIASPGDTKEQRGAIRATILDWNDSNAQFYQVTLLPVMWETHSYPAIGRPQGVINEQIVEDGDILIGTFWTRLGTPTSVAESGTAEEISQFEKSGRPVLLYFCEAPGSVLTLDTAEIERLKDYRREMQSRALVGTYLTPDELQSKLRDDLTRLVRDMKERGEIPPLPNLGLDSTVESGSEAPASTIVSESNRELEDLRQVLVGYKMKWEGQLLGMNFTDPSIDKRRDLAKDIARITWDLVQGVGERCSGAPIIGALAAVGTIAEQVAATRVYMDGGKSFNALNDGCKKAVQAVQGLVNESWECGSAVAE